MGAGEARDERRESGGRDPGDQGLPEHYFRALSLVRQRALIRNILHRYRKVSSNWAEDGVQEALVALVAYRQILRNAPPLSAPRDERWFKAAETALFNFAVAKGVENIAISKAVFGARSRWRSAAERGSTELTFLGELPLDSRDLQEESARARKEGDLPEGWWERVAAAFERRTLGRRSDDPEGDADRRREYFEVLRRVASEEGDSPLAERKRKEGPDDRPFRLGAAKVQINQKRLLNELQKHYPDASWDEAAVRTRTAHLKRFFARYRRESVVEDMLGEDDCSK